MSKDDDTPGLGSIPIDAADNVVTLKVQKKPPLDERPQLKLTQFGGCQHVALHVQFEIDPVARTVSCSCGALMDPLDVLIKFTNVETRYRANLEATREAQARLAKRARTKCMHCGEMTPIKGIF